MISCIIVDDEFPSREELKHFIEKFSSIKIKAEFDNAFDVLKYLDEDKVDCIFLDINMPNINGVDLGKIIHNRNKEIKIIFITAYKEYAVEAFELEAFDYLLKPYSQERIVNLLKKLEKSRTVSSRGDILSLWRDEKIIVIKTSDICFCEVVEGKTMIHTKDDEYVFNGSLSQLTEKLQRDKFFKTHRAFIVNTEKIKEIIPWFNNTYMLKIIGTEKQVPVSRNNINKFKHFMDI